MPTNESNELASIRQAAELLTSERTSAAEHMFSQVFLEIDTVRMLEQQMWAAYALACEAEARREGAEEMRRKMWQQQIDDNANIAAGHAAGVFPG